MCLDSEKLGTYLLSKTIAGFKSGCQASLRMKERTRVNYSTHRIKT